MLLSGLFPLMPAIALLTVSFFVLVAVTKIESRALQSFGRIIATVLCIFAGIMIITFLYCSLTGKSYKSWKHPMKYMKCPMGYDSMMKK